MWAGIDVNTIDACAASGSALGDASTVTAANITAQFGYDYAPTAWPGTPTVVLQGKVVIEFLGRGCFQLNSFILGLV
jgi:hypothetical protein